MNDVNLARFVIQSAAKDLFKSFKNEIPRSSE